MLCVSVEVTKQDECKSACRLHHKDLLVFGTRPVLEDFIQRYDGLSQEHVDPDKDPEHDGEGEETGTGWMCTHTFQQAGLQLQGTLLVPLGLGGLLGQPGNVLLLPELNNGVNIAAALLPFYPQSSGALDSHIHVCGDPFLIVLVLQADERHLPETPTSGTKLQLHSR